MAESSRLFHDLVVVDPLSSTHPRFRTNCLDPISERRNEAEVFANVLLADPSNGNDPASGQRNSRAEDSLRHENALGVMSKSAVAEVRSYLLRCVEPVMDALIVFDRAAPFLHAGKR